jgi:hypothetical protein
MKYIGKYLSGEIRLARECTSKPVNKDHSRGPENVTFLWTVALYIQVKIICNIRLGRK